MDFEEELAKIKMFYVYDTSNDLNVISREGEKAIKEIIDSEDDEIFRIECVFDGMICWSNEDRSKNITICFKDMALLNLQTYMRLKELGCVLKRHKDNIYYEDSGISIGDSFNIDLFE